MTNPCIRVVMEGEYPEGHPLAGEKFTIEGLKCLACGTFLGTKPPSEHECYAMPTPYQTRGGEATIIE